MTIYNAYLIKGWMVDKTPPDEVKSAIEEVIASLTPRPEAETPAAKPKKKYTWSPERRAAAAQRMKDMRARQQIVAGNSEPGEGDALSDSSTGSAA